MKLQKAPTAAYHVTYHVTCHVDCHVACHASCHVTCHVDYHVARHVAQNIALLLGDACARVRPPVAGFLRHRPSRAGTVLAGQLPLCRVPSARTIY